MRWVILALAILGLVGEADAQEAQPVQVMIVGTYHFDNPGLDLNNAKVDDVLKPNRQRELRRLVEALAQFEPTKIMIERVPTTPDLVDQRYNEFQPADLTNQRDERVQIAYRLASHLKLPVVYAIDEQPSSGEPDYFPFVAVSEWSTANGFDAQLNKLMAEGAAATMGLEAAQQTSSIPQLLAKRNEPTAIAAEQALYYEFLQFGGIEQQPGADLNAMWYLRNAKIFAKLQKVVKPGDRVLVVYGSGHNYWLRHFAATARGYQLVEALPFLERAAR